MPRTSALQGLTPRELRFIDAFMHSGNMTQSAIQAGYGAASAAVAGHQVLRRPRVLREIERRKAKIDAKRQMTRDDLIDKLESVVNSNMAMYMRRNKETGDPQLSLADLTPDETYALSEVTIETYTEGRGDDAQTVKKVKFKRADALKAAELLTKLRGWEKPRKIDIGIRSMDTVPDSRTAEQSYMDMLNGDPDESTDDSE